MSRIKLEDIHIVPGVYIPQDIDALQAAKSPVIVLMKNYAQALVLFQLALPKAAGVITIESCSDTVPTVATQIMFPYYRYETSSIVANGDVHGARTWTTTAAAGLIPVATTTPALYVVEIRAEMLLTDHVGFRVCIADPAAASIGGVMAILSGGRYQENNVTAQAVV